MPSEAGARLEQLRREATRRARTTRASRGGAQSRRRMRVRARWSPTALLAGTAKPVAMVVLPFAVYVRTSVAFYQKLGGAPWIAVAGALLITIGLVALHATWLARRIVDRPWAGAVARRIVAPMAAGWLVYSLVFLARVNAKTDDVRGTYASLHPVLRVAVSVAIIADPGAVITDMQRRSQDYGRMGLPVNPNTRHYRMDDGWVYAVDLRTRGRSEVRNRALELYFRAMGFSTTRHVGTADHLHVQLRSP